jgi:hypothetical protein
MAKKIPANIAQAFVLTANENFIALQALLKSMINLVSKCIGVYEMRIRLYLWELSNTSKHS